MYLENLQLENFGPYYGLHEIDLRVDDSHPMIVFHGENMRGKTSIFNALRWVLYGTALSRQKEVLGADDLFNSIALESGAPQASVVLTFEDDGQTFVATRCIVAQGGGRLATRFKLQVGASIVSAEAAEEMIASLMDESIGRFFLFDGEMLGEYERLLADSTSESATVRQSIESILGLPALRLLADDLATLAREAYERESKRSTAEKKADQAATEHAAKVVLLGETDESLRRAERQLIRLNAKRAEVAKEQAALNETRVTIERITAAEAKRDANARAVNDARERIQGLLRERWWFPVSARIDDQLLEVRGRLRAATARDARLHALRETERSLKDSLGNSNCDTCGQPLPDASLAPIRERLRMVDLEIAEVTAPVTPTVTELLTLEDQLRPFMMPPDVGNMRDLELRIRKLRQENRILNQDIDELQASMRGHEEAHVRAKQIEYDEIVRSIGRLSKELEGLRERKSKLQGELAQLQRKFAKKVEGAGQTALEQALFQSLSDIFGGALGRFREALRLEVQKEATRIFLALTTEKDYRGLAINDQYGLRILDEAGGVLRIRSAGAEQIVALSLIGALNACAVRRGPLVMDTPFGRLDEGHRGNILEWAPGVSRQVILLVQSGEVDPQGALLERVKPAMRREYRIVRDGSPRKSKLELVRG